MLFPDIRVHLRGKSPGLAQAAGPPGSLFREMGYGRIAGRLPNRSKNCAFLWMSCASPVPEQFCSAAGSRYLPVGDCGETFLSPWSLFGMSGRTSSARR
jgi:hypothetical protein